MTRLTLTTAILLLGCATTKGPHMDIQDIAKRLQVQDLNTSHWATAQDKVFASDSIPKTWDKFNALYKAQTMTVVSNLSFRDDCIRAAMGNQIYALYAKEKFEIISQHGGWAEGPGYFDYSRTAIDWYFRVTGKHIIPPAAVDAIQAVYDAISGPDGSLPLPMTRASYMTSNPGKAATVNTPNFYVKRWFSGDTVKAQIIICKSSFAIARNLHSHRLAGYVAIWVNGVWVHRANWYTGFDFLKGLTSADLAASLPPGALLQDWRINPPNVRVVQHPNEIYIQWGPNTGAGAYRKVTWTDSSITLDDEGREPITWGW